MVMACGVMTLDDGVRIRSEDRCMSKEKQLYCLYPPSAPHQSLLLFWFVLLFSSIGWQYTEYTEGTKGGLRHVQV